MASQGSETERSPPIKVSSSFLGVCVRLLIKATANSYGVTTHPSCL
jgi:hypothetical protein